MTVIDHIARTELFQNHCYAMRKELFLLIVLFILMPVTGAFAQDSSNAFQDAQRLRDQLSQLKDREAEIKIRLAELDNDLKPENIARHFAGVGAVHPEELRETRRKQLQTEKDRLVGQLSEIDQNQTRLQTEIQLAESKAYQQNAMGVASLKPRDDRPSSRRWFAPLMTATVMRIGALTFALIVVGIVLFAARKRQRR